MTKKKPKPRKPRELRFPGYSYISASIWKGSSIDANPGELSIDANTGDMNTTQARTLAAWLIKAADWIEAQETK